MPDLVAEAMKSLGWRIAQQDKVQIYAHSGSSTVRWESGKGVSVKGYGNRNDQQAQITALTKAYSAAGVKWAAQKAGWQVQQTDPDKLTVSRR
jgi:hypothetical protein